MYLNLDEYVRNRYKINQEKGVTKPNFFFHVPVFSIIFLQLLSYTACVMWPGVILFICFFGGIKIQRWVSLSLNFLTKTHLIFIFWAFLLHNKFQMGKFHILIFKASFCYFLCSKFDHAVTLNQDFPDGRLQADFH